MNFNKSVTTALLILLSGCTSVFERNYHEVTFYDLSLGTPAPLNNEIRILPVKAEIPNLVKMLVTLPDGSITDDPYNRWIQPPSTMLTRCFKLSFDSNQKQPALLLETTLLAFSIDLEEQSILLALKYGLKKDGEKVASDLLRIRKKAVSSTPEGFAKAFSEAATEAVHAIAETGGK